MSAAVLTSLLLPIIALMGHDDYEHRQMAELAVVAIVTWTDDVKPLLLASESDPDPEIRRRCRHVLDWYYTVTVPEEVILLDFPPEFAAEEYGWACHRGITTHEAAVLYVQFMMDHGRGRRAVMRQIGEATSSRKRDPMRGPMR